MNMPTSSTVVATEEQVLLQDGRLLAYADYGDKAGYPVLFMHGAPGSRKSVHPDMAEMAARIGVRVIVPDRPGYGSSDVLTERTLSAWPQDIGQLVDALDIERFSVGGYSMGGIYALACAHSMATRIDRVTIVGGFGPLDSPESTADMSPEIGGIFNLARSDPASLRGVLSSLAVSPDAVLQAMGAPMPACDQIVLQGRHQAFLDDIAESLRFGIEGLVSDFVIATRPWGFAPTDVRMKINWWHGELDRNVPLATALPTMNQIPQCLPRLLKGEGHLVLAAHWEEVLQTLLEEG